jgi:hypothetical protein
MTIMGTALSLEFELSMNEKGKVVAQLNDENDEKQS